MMRKSMILAVTLLAMVGCARKDDPIAEGKAAFEGFGCVNCHSVGPTGGVYGPDLTYIGFRKSPEWLEAWLKDPHAWRKHTMMPNFNLHERTRGALVAFLAAQKGQAYEKGKAPWDEASLQENKVLKGEVVFAKAGCNGCHGVRGIGGYPNNNVVGGLIPSLTLAADGYSKHELRELLVKGRNSAPADMSQPAPMIKMPAWGEVLEEDEIEAVIEYVYSLKPKNGGDAW